MAITVNGAILRNMPEQISKNVEDIADLQTTTNNQETRIAALENSTILAATFEDCTFTGTTEVQGDLNQTSGDLAVTNNATIGGTLGVTGTVTASNDLDVGGDLSVGVDASVSGDLAVTGAITGGSIIENMSGYTWSPNGNLATNGISMTYVGVVKNGNKITFAIAGTFDSTITPSSTLYLGNFVIPEGIRAKMIPAFNNILESKPTNLITSSFSIVNKNLISYTSGTQNVGLYLQNMTSGFDNTSTYYFRHEVTFLLSDNLAQ